MLKTLFGDITGGRVPRLPFLGYWLLLVVVLLVVIIGIGAAVGAAEHLVGGDLESAQAQLRSQFGLPALAVGIVVVAGFVFAGANLYAKRLRDIGLPGWWTVLGLIVAGLVISLAISDKAAGGFDFLVWVALLVVPTGAVRS